MYSSYNALFQEATEALARKQYAKAEKLQRQGLELLRGQMPDAPQISNELEKLAGIHFVQEEFDIAASEYDQVLDLCEKVTPKDKSAFLRIAYWLAESQFKGQKYELAEATLRRALPMTEELPDDLALFSYELGFLMYFVGRYQEAEPFLLKALSLYETRKGPSHPWTVQSLERLALTYRFCPEIGKDPEPYFRRAVEVIKPEGEMRHTYMANLCRLAEYVAEHERYEESDELYSQILDLLQDPSETEHWISSSCLEYFRKRGKDDLVAKLATAEASYDAYGEMLTKQIEHAEQKLSEDDPQLAEALLRAGNNAIFHAKHEDAERLLARALDVYKSSHGDVSEPVVKTLTQLCIARRMLNKFDEAEQAIQRALEIAHHHFSHSDVFPRSLETFAHLREAQARKAEATELHEQAIREYERICGFPSYQTLEALYRQSGYLLRTGKVGSAETTIRRALSAIDRVQELSNYEKSDYWSVLSSVLESTGRHSEAEDAQKRAQELFEQAKKEEESEG